MKRNIACISIHEKAWVGTKEKRILEEMCVDSLILFRKILRLLYKERVAIFT
jgi:hypothetical protein